MRWEWEEMSAHQYRVERSEWQAAEGSQYWVLWCRHENGKGDNDRKMTDFRKY
jgi:hypothetical protein